MLISSGARGRIATIAEFGIESRHGHSGTFVFFSDAKRFLPEAIRLFQDDQLQRVAQGYLAKEGASKVEPTVASQIAIYRESSNQPHSVARAVLATLISNPSPELLERFRAQDAQALKKIAEESPDSDLALIRLLAASGLAFATLLGMSSLSRQDRERLYARLLDEQAWAGATNKSAKKKKRA